MVISQPQSEWLIIIQLNENWRQSWTSSNPHTIGTYLEGIDPIPLQLNPNDLLRDLRPPKLHEELLNLWPTAQSLIEPRAVYATMRVTAIENDCVQLGNHQFLSIVLADLLEVGQDTLVYVVTIGSKLEEEAKQRGLLQSFLLDKIGNYAVNQTCRYIKSNIANRLGSIISEFSPGTGTGELFAIEQQKPLFQILMPETSIRVRLSSSLMMIPRKSESGIFAATHEEYVSCEHCPRDCESRQAPYADVYLRRKR